MTASTKTLALIVGLAALGGAAYWATGGTETTYRVSGVHAVGDGDVIVAYFLDDGGESRSTHVARRSPASDATSWELELSNAMIVGHQQGMLIGGETLVVADRPAPDQWRVRGVDANSGSVRWTHDLRGEADHWPELFGTDDHVFVIGGEPRLQVLSIDAGEQVFEHGFDMLAPPHFNERWLLVSKDEDGVAFVDLTTMSLTEKLPAIDGEVCLIDDAVYGLSSLSSSTKAVVRQALATGTVTRFEAQSDGSAWPPTALSCGWMDENNGLRLVVRDLEGQLVALDLDPDNPTAGARKAFEIAVDGGKIAQDSGSVPKDAARPLRGKLTRFAPVEITHSAENGIVWTYGVVDLERGVLSHEGAPFSDSTVTTIDWVRDLRNENRILINAEWYEPGGPSHRHVGVFDGSSGTLVADLQGKGVTTQAAAVGSSRTWLWVEDGFSAALRLFPYDDSFQPLAPTEPASGPPEPSDELNAIFGLPVPGQG